MERDVDSERSEVGSHHLMPVPPLPAFHIARPRLLDLLDAGADTPLTAVVAPPGAGKSVLLASWVRDRCPDAAWVACEEPDRDPVLFWTKVGSALLRVQGERWLDVCDLLSDPDPDLVAVVDMMLHTLADRPAVLVLDDVHTLRDAGPLLSRLVERLPGGSRLVTGSRGDPALALHRLRATDRYLDVREADLRLRADEVHALLDALGVSVSVDTTRLLTDHIDGWAAGVQMAAIALRGEADPDRFLAEFSGRTRIVSDYLVEEVLVQQSDLIRRFLLRTSVLDELEPGACAAVTGDADATTILRRLDDSALFVVSLGNGIYRYHQLFRDMLRYQLQAISHDEILDAHRRAAAWYENQGTLASALAHWVSAGDHDRAYALLQTELGRTYLDSGPLATRALVAAVSEADATLDPGRMVTLGSALALVGALTPADAWLQRAARRIDDLDDAGRTRLTAAQGLLAVQQGDARRALELLDGFDPQGSDDGVVMAAPAFAIWPRGWLHDFHGGREAATRTRTLRSPGVVYDEITVPGALSWIACVEGSLREARDLAEKALATALEFSLPDHPALVDPLRTRGRLCFERGDLPGAEAALERSMVLAETWRPSFALVTAATIVRVQISQGRMSDAKQAVAVARSFLATGIDSPLSTVLDALDARIALLEGDRDLAESITRALEPSMRRSRLLARLELAAGKPEAALAALAQPEPATPRERVDLMILRARCEDELASANSDTALATAIDAARIEGFSFAIAEELFPLSRRVGALLRAAPLDDFAVSVLALLEHIVPLAESATHSTLVDPLTDREVMVLRYLGSRLTTSEIAGELYVSVNTVRTHAKAVYRKLAVTSRHDAVAEARRLGIR